LKTSKILLTACVVAWIVAIFTGRVVREHVAASFGAIVAVMVWNRIDSRGKGYQFRLKGPGGSELSVQSDGGGQPGEDGGRPGKGEGGPGEGMPPDDGTQPGP
jgi:hypothetical protein